MTLRPAAPLSAQLRTWTYGAGSQNATGSLIVGGTASAAAFAHGITMPAESMIILKSR